MKRIITVLATVAVVLSLAGCKNDKSNKPTVKKPINKSAASNQDKEDTAIEETNDPTAPNQESEPNFIKLSESDESLLLVDESIKYEWGQSFGENDYFIKTIYSKGEESTTEYVLRNRETQNEIVIDFPEWDVGSGSTVVLKDRYQYEWLSLDKNGSFEVSLVMIDGQTGEVKILDALDKPLPFIYLSKIDDEHFISTYSSTALYEDDGYKDTETIISVYNADGTSKEIIREKCRSFDDGKDSEGVLLQSACSMDGKIYSYGWQTVGGKSVVYLYTYNADGKFENKEELTGELADVLLNESLIRFDVVNDYIILRTWNLNSYIFKKGENQSELIIPRGNHPTFFGFSKNSMKSSDVKYIYFIEREVDGTSPKFADLQAVELSSGKIKGVPLEPNSDYPYMTDFMIAANGDLVLKYQKSDGESGEVISGKLRVEYLLTASNLTGMFDNAE